MIRDTAIQQSVRSPEGVELRFRTAAASERLVALALDLALGGVLLVVAGLLLTLLSGLGGLRLVFFVVRHGYFIWCETRGYGSTPGKRRLHLRVIRADGGPLTTEILLARNLTREVELFLPLMLLLNPDALFGEHHGVVRIVASAWILLLLFFPLTNPLRLRIGDLLAGTRVVVSPPAALMRDLADSKSTPSAPSRAAEFQFTAAQLTVYGEHELTVLEDVLRKANTPDAQRTLRAVTKSICGRIGWADPAAIGERHERFLRAFYTAQREHLEQQLLLGRRRLRKQDQAARKP